MSDIVAKTHILELTIAASRALPSADSKCCVRNLAHVPGASMTVVTQTPSNYMLQPPMTPVGALVPNWWLISGAPDKGRA